VIPETPPTGILLGGHTYWDPVTLPNPHLLGIGASGSGKTQTLKALAWTMRLIYPDVRLIIIDFHGDQKLPGEIAYPLHMNSPYGINPLIVDLDVEGGGPDLQAIQVASILRKTLQLGPNQEGLMLNLLKELYSRKNISQSRPATWINEPPTFANLEDLINYRSTEDDECEKLQIKMAATFTYGIFSRPQPSFSDDPLIRLDVSKLPPQIGAIAAESLATQILNEHRLKGEGPLRTMLFIDEAKEMPRSTPTRTAAIERISMDGRKYGLGMVLASQSERHLSVDVIGNCHTKVILPVDPSEIKKVASKFRVSDQVLASLDKLEAVVRMGPKVQRTPIHPYYLRLA
jgi:hypothetical protein